MRDGGEAQGGWGLGAPGQDEAGESDARVRGEVPLYGGLGTGEEAEVSGEQAPGVEVPLGGDEVQGGVRGKVRVSDGTVLAAMEHMAET